MMSPLEIIPPFLIIITNLLVFTTAVPHGPPITPIDSTTGEKAHGLIKELSTAANISSSSSSSSILLDILTPGPGAAPEATKLEVKREFDLSDFYVITAIFNPASYKSRYTLYHKFAQHILDSGASLVTIECIFPSLGQTEFQVTNSVNPFHIQLKSEDSVYWVKEDLINIAVSRLPANAKWVAWLDADIKFHESDWIQRSISALEKYPVVQMFKYAHFLNAEEEILRTDYSFGYSVVQKKPVLNFLNANSSIDTTWYPHPGYGWAMPIETFKTIGGLPNYDLVGSGDLYFAYSLVNETNNVLPTELNSEYKLKIVQTAQDTFSKLKNLATKTQDGDGIVGYSNVTLSHYWHGSRKDRGYVERNNILIAHNFNYWTDVTRDSDGLIVFKNGTESLQKDINCYFEKRNEDGEGTDTKNNCNSIRYISYVNHTKKLQKKNEQSCTNWYGNDGSDRDSESDSFDPEDGEYNLNSNSHYYHHGNQKNYYHYSNYYIQHSSQSLTELVKALRQMESESRV